MSRRVLVVAFDDEHRLLAALRHARAARQDVLDVHAPYPVHGLPELLGERPSRLPWACLAGGLVGLTLGWALQVWTSAHDWPLNVGGKPVNSTPAFVPVAFELTILLAGLGVVAAFFLVERGRTPVPRASFRGRATDDLFVVSIGARDATFDGEALGRVYREQLGACEVEELLVEDAS
ncbi:MAG: DUF3341 domain-containing protein [Planctomycetota bacterium]